MVSRVLKRRRSAEGRNGFLDTVSKPTKNGERENPRPRLFEGDRALPFRLQVIQGERTRRIPLPEGPLVLGSSEQADIRLTQLSVSRRHARLHVSAGGVEVEDLGSRNGTRLDGVKVQGRMAVPPGVPLLFGTAVTILEALAVEDAEVGIVLTTAQAEARGKADGPGGRDTTFSPSALERFALSVLPELLACLETPDEPSSQLQTVGEGLYRSLPCFSVEILRRGGKEDALLFSATRGSENPEADDGHLVEVKRGELVVAVLFKRANLAVVYEPLVQVGASLIALALRLGESAKGDRPVRAPRETLQLPSPLTVDPAVRRIYTDAARIATGTVSVLIRGESGTGKEVLARFIHSASPRAAGPLVTLNCAALPRDLLESELFGVEGGVATGVDARPGRFELAHGGTLFLDEIGDMALETQARILRVLQEAEVFRVGGQEARPADVRVVSATNRDLEAMLEDGGFRGDLYHRIADWVVELPPLRERREDITNLAAFFLGRACAERGVAAAGISRAALRALRAFSWPGNIRQLEKEMGRAALFLEDGDLLDTTRLQSSITDSTAEESPTRLKSVLEEAERRAIEAALLACDGEMAATASRLGVSRSTLYRRLAALGIEG